MKLRPFAVVFWHLAFLSGCQTTIPGEGSATLQGSGRSFQDSPGRIAHWKKFFSDDPQLVSLIDRTLANNRDLKIALARIDSARARVQATKGALRPTVEAKFDAVRGRSGRYIDDDYSNAGSDLQAGLQARWELDLWGRLRSEKGAAFDRMLASAESRRLVQSNLIAELSGAYYELRALDAKLEILDRTQKLQEDAIQSVEAQLEAGQVTSLALQQFQAQLKNVQSLRWEIESEIVTTEGTVQSLLGTSGQPIPRGKSPLSQVKLPPLAARVPSSQLANRPDVLQAELELSAAKADVKAAKAAFYPGVTIDGMLGLQAFRANRLLHSRSLAHSVGGGLVAPLINRSAIQAEFADANAAQLEAFYQYQQTLVNAYVEVHNQIANGRLLERIGKLKGEERYLLDESAATSIELFHTGRATYLEVLTSRQSALEAGLEEIEIRKRQLQTVANLYRALGGG